MLEAADENWMTCQLYLEVEDGHVEMAACQVEEQVGEDDAEVASQMEYRCMEGSVVVDWLEQMQEQVQAWARVCQELRAMGARSGIYLGGLDTSCPADTPRIQSGRDLGRADPLLHARRSTLDCSCARGHYQNSHPAHCFWGM